jgi:hypothetical protein
MMLPYMLDSRNTLSATMLAVEIKYVSQPAMWHWHRLKED